MYVQGVLVHFVVNIEMLTVYKAVCVPTLPLPTYRASTYRHWISADAHMHITGHAQHIAIVLFQKGETVWVWQVYTSSLIPV